MPENRIEPTTVANQAENARLASIVPPSPTGAPLIPARFAPWLMVVSTVAGIPAALAGAGVAVPTAILTVASSIGVLALVLLGGSPGLRK